MSKLPPYIRRNLGSVQTLPAKIADAELLLNSTPFAGISLTGIVSDSVLAEAHFPSLKLICRNAEKAAKDSRYRTNRRISYVNLAAKFNAALSEILEPPRIPAKVVAEKIKIAEQKNDCALQVKLDRRARLRQERNKKRKQNPPKYLPKIRSKNKRKFAEPKLAEEVIKKNEAVSEQFIANRRSLITVIRAYISEPVLKLISVCRHFEAAARSLAIKTGILDNSVKLKLEQSKMSNMEFIAHWMLALRATGILNECLRPSARFSLRKIMLSLSQKPLSCRHTRSTVNKNKTWPEFSRFIVQIYQDEIRKKDHNPRRSNLRFVSQNVDRFLEKLNHDLKNILSKKSKNLLSKEKHKGLSKEELAEFRKKKFIAALDRAEALAYSIQKTALALETKDRIAVVQAAPVLMQLKGKPKRIVAPLMESEQKLKADFVTDQKRKAEARNEDRENHKSILAADSRNPKEVAELVLHLLEHFSLLNSNGLQIKNQARVHPARKAAQILCQGLNQECKFSKLADFFESSISSNEEKARSAKAALSYLCECYKSLRVGNGSLELNAYPAKTDVNPNHQRGFIKFLQSMENIYGGEVVASPDVTAAKKFTNEKQLATNQLTGTAAKQQTVVKLQPTKKGSPDPHRTLPSNWAKIGIQRIRVLYTSDFYIGRAQSTVQTIREAYLFSPKLDITTERVSKDQFKEIRRGDQRESDKSYLVPADES